MIDSQWENFLKNKGEWHGSFTKFSPEGIKLADVPSILSLESFNNDLKARITLRRFYPQTDPNKEPLAKTLLQEFQPPLDSNLLFFDNGSFCRGILQIDLNSSPTIEFGLLQENRRSRQIQKYSLNGNLESITLIREQKYPQLPKGENLEIEALLGTRIANAIELDRELKINKYQISTRFDRQGDKLVRVTTVNGEENTQTGKIEGSVVDFDTMGDGRRGSPETKWYLYRGGNATRGILMPVNISL